MKSVLTVQLAFLNLTPHIFQNLNLDNMNYFPLFFYLLFLSYVYALPGVKQHYEAIYSFGDSLTDTGNFLRSGALAFPTIAKLPYGETFFQHPTGRCSNGRLVVDFLGRD